MTRVLTTLAALVVASLSGCKAPVAPPPAPLVNSVVAGKWLVSSIDGKPVASGTEIHVEYQQNGSVSVEVKGDAASVPSLDEKELKRALDGVAPPQGGLLDDFEITAGGTKIKLKWNGDKREVPMRPVPPNQ